MNAGANLTADGITRDHAGTARPQGPAFDIGAYEYLEGPGIEWSRAPARRGGELSVRSTSLGEVSIISTGPAKISASIYSLKGETLGSIENIGTHGATWNPGKSSSGVYLVRVQLGNEIRMAKIYCGKWGR